MRVTEADLVDGLMALDRDLRSARCARDVFGDNVASRLRELRLTCHPDLFLDPTMKALAEATTKRLVALADEAAKPPLAVKSPKREYSLLRLLTAGDVADVHLAESGGTDYVFKVSRVPEGVAALEAENKALSHLLTKSSGDTYSKYLPTLVESFPIRDTIQKRANVFVHEPGFYSLTQVRDAFPMGLDGRHLAWIFNRLLEILGFVHRYGRVHGAILPPHVLLHAANHGLKLVGWGQSVEAGQVITSGCPAYLDWYPNRVKEKLPARDLIDIEMAARCVIYVAGGDPVKGTLPAGVPTSMARFLWACLVGGGTDCWTLREEWGDLQRSLYGPRKFVELHMP